MHDAIETVLQHPFKPAVQFSIHTFKIVDRDLLLQYHLVKADDEIRVEESAMENGQTHATADKFEVVQMLWVDARSRINLKRIVVVCGVLEETIEWIEHFVRQKEEIFSVAKKTVRVYHYSPQISLIHLERPP